MTTPQNLGYCTGQCWYDNVVYSPPEDPNVVYLGGSFSYGQQNVVNNGRAVVMSTDGGVTFSDMTRDKNDDGWLHPDQHALVTMPGKPLQWIAGDDGGIVRSDGKYVDGSGTVRLRRRPARTSRTASRFSTASRTRHRAEQGARHPAVPEPLDRPEATRRTAYGRHAGQRHLRVQGRRRNDWPQIIYGDGGQSGWSASDSKLRFNTFTGQAAT